MGESEKKRERDLKRYRIFNNQPAFSMLVYADIFTVIGRRFHLSSLQLYLLIIANMICEIGDGYYKFAQINAVAEFLSIPFGSQTRQCNASLVDEGIVSFFRRDRGTKMFFVTLVGENILNKFRKLVRVKTSEFIELIN